MSPTVAAFKSAGCAPTSYTKQFPDQIVNQAFTLPHEMTLRETADGLRVCFAPVKETEKLRGEVLAEGKDLTLAQANELLRKCEGELSEVVIEFADDGPKDLLINGIDASFEGRAARIFTDRTFNEVYADDGLFYEIRKRSPQEFRFNRNSHRKRSRSNRTFTESLPSQRRSGPGEHEIPFLERIDS